MSELTANGTGAPRYRSRSLGGFAVDRLNTTVFLADNDERLVMVLRSTGRCFLSFQANPDSFDSGFDRKMRGMAFDPHTKYLYICGCGRKGPNNVELIGQVAVFDTTAGEYLYSIGRRLLRNPTAIAIDANQGLLFVADTMPALKIFVFQI